MRVESPSRRTEAPPLADPERPQRFWTINALVVDDDAADTFLIVDALKRHRQVSAVRSSDDPDEALRDLATGRLRPDLVLLDIHMPRMDGFTFLKRMREIPRAAPIPVVLLTTSGLGRDMMIAKDSSAASYVIKPDTFSELQIRLDNAIRRTISGRWDN